MVYNYCDCPLHVDAQPKERPHNEEEENIYSLLQEEFDLLTAEEQYEIMYGDQVEMTQD